jgi:hypothetical protein
MVTPDPPGSNVGATGPEPIGDAWPAPGALHIKGRVAWKSWQVAALCLVTFLVGLGLNYKPVGASGGSAGAPSYKLPTSTGSTTTTAPSTGGGSSASTTTTTTAAGGSSTTTTSSSTSSSTSTTAAAGPARVLLGPTQLQGNWTSPTFTTTVADWNIGWAFRCSPAPAGGPSFQVYVTPVGGSPSGTPAVTQTGASGQSVTAVSSLGAQTLVVQAPAGCSWVVKVTGS